MTETPFGPTGELIFRNTYARPKPDGTLEDWPETVSRVAKGNLALVHGEDDCRWPEEAWAEYEALCDYMRDFRIIPGGRHLWATGVKGRQYLSNCHVAGWGDKLSDHFSFTFLRLMEGGGVGANYSSEHLVSYGPARRELNVHVVCDPTHPDYEEMRAAGLISDAYSPDWVGSFLVEDSREGWAAALTDLIDTYMTLDTVHNVNRVYDVTNVRARGSRLKTFGGTASGPLPFARLLHTTSDVLNRNFVAQGHWVTHGLHQLSPLDAMEIDHAIGECVVSGGVRRSARMSIVRWDDPFVHDFLDCKSDTSKHWTTNISVEVDDAFIAAASSGDEHARQILLKITTGMLTNGEPGLWNSSLSQTGEIGNVIATNPCGEIALEAWENCNLGHVNLDAFAGRPVSELDRAHELMTRFLIRATYADHNDDAQAAVVAANRRIGVGHLGVQGFLVKSGIRYSEAPSNEGFKEMLRSLHATVRLAADDYAFELRIPSPVKTTTVAPTGTIAKLPGVSEGIHPIFARHFIRRIRWNVSSPRGRQAVEDAIAEGFTVEDDAMDPSGYTKVVEYPTKDILVEQVESLALPASLVESQDEIPVEALLAFQTMYQTHWADNAVSFTINVPAALHQELALQQGAPCPPPTQSAVIELATTLMEYLPHIKGTTVMVDGTRPQAPYERISEDAYEAAQAHLVSDGIDEECATGACPIR